MKYAANEKNVYLGTKQQCKQIVKLLNSVTSREMYAKVAYFISVTIQHRCRNYNNLQRNQEHCKWDIWINEVNIKNTAYAGDLAWISLTRAEFRNLLWTVSAKIAEEWKKLRKPWKHSEKKGNSQKTRIETPTSCWTDRTGPSIQGII